MKSRGLEIVVAIAVVAGITAFGGRVWAQVGELTRTKGGLPSEIIRPKVTPEMALANVKTPPISSVLGRLAAFRPLQTSFTLEPLKPTGADGVLSVQNVYRYDFVEGNMIFFDKYGGLCVYFRPAEAGAKYVADFTIEVTQPTEVEMWAGGFNYSVSKSGEGSMSKLKKGVHRLTVPLTCINGDFLVAYLLSYTDKVFWQFRSVTVTKV